MNDLVTHIKERNEVEQTWVDQDPSNRWAGMLTTDVEHWAQYGVYTEKDLEKFLLAENIADASREARGFKDRVNWKEHSLEELEFICRYWCKEASAAFDEEQKFKARNAKRFETRIEETINMGAGHRENAIRWIVEAEEYPHHTYQSGYATYDLNLPSSYNEELDSIIYELIRKREAA